jgi:hypothetical protein
MGPRAQEVTIVYQEMVEKHNKDGEVVKVTWEKHKAKLQDLLNRLQEVGVHRWSRSRARRLTRESYSSNPARF